MNANLNRQFTDASSIPPKLNVLIHPAPPASTIKELNAATPIILPNYIVRHHPKAGINVVVDTAGYLFSIIGKLKEIKSYRQLNKLQTELIQEINVFFEAIQNYKYNLEYTIVCRYILCAVLDETILTTHWGKEHWQNYSLLLAFNQDPQHHNIFFNIMERAIKEPKVYIDLMELMYFCLSMGYKGQYHTTEENHFQLEQITNNLYRHIQAYRGNVSKSLSPSSLKIANKHLKKLPKKFSLTVIFLITACVVMTIFISLGYIMDIISNETYQSIALMENSSQHALIN